jgi:hypothetical protein
MRRLYNIPVVNQLDVLIVGGGMAGCSAAIAAAREGASVQLVEQHGYLGGNATRAMVGPWQSFHAGRCNADGSLPPQVIGGIAQEFVNDLISLGACLGHIPDPIGFAGSLTPVDSAQLQLYLPQKLAQVGVKFELNTLCTLELLNNAVQVVDATGTAAAARMLGAVVVEPGEPQPLSWLFTMQGVDTDVIRDYQFAHPEQFVLHPAFARLRPDFVAVSGFFDLVRQARERGDFAVPRDRLLFFSTPTPGEVLINTTRIAASHPDPHQEGLRQVHWLLDWLPRHVPGLRDARPGRIADGIGQRESFRLQGRDTLRVEQITGGLRHPEAIARGCYPIDIHSTSGSELASQGIGGKGWYDIPLGCLESATHPQLLAAGRCISADRSGFASARVLPTAMATGQAAGFIAAHRAVPRNFSLSACLSLISLV